MRRPSAAFILAGVALVLALGGSAVAGHLITSRDIKDRSIKGRDLKSNTITGRIVKNLSGRDILDDSLDGTDIAEELLGPVPRAGRAENAASAERAAVADALAGADVVRVHFTARAGGESEFLHLGGLRLTGRCSSSGALTVVAANTGDRGWVRTSATMQRSANDTVPLLVEDDDFRGGDEFDALPSGADNVAGDIVYLGGDGATVTVSFLAEGNIAADRGYACLVAGTATHTTG